MAKKNEALQTLKAVSEQELEKQDKFYRTLIEESGDAFIIRNREGIITYVSPSIKRVFGLNENEIVGQPGSKLVHEDQLNVSIHDWDYILKNPGKIIHVDQKVILPDGSIRHIEGSSRNLLDVDPIYGVVSNFRDVTQKRKAEVALIESQERMEGIISSAHDAIISIDSDYRVVLFNRAAEMMFDIEAAEIFGNMLGVIIPGNQTIREKSELFVNKAQTHSRLKPSMKGLRSDGTILPLDVSISSQRIDDEVFHTLIIRDISYETELSKRNENLLNELQQRVNEQDKILKLFTRYVPESVVNKTLTTSDESLFDGETRYVTVLFCDIRGFTHLSEDMEPREVVGFLNYYYSLMTRIIKEFNGTVTQFVGDEVFATFGAPIDTTENERNAVYCALKMIRKTSAISERAGQQIAIGIGIHSGEVIAGNLGSEEKLDYAITGDTVNTGKRIEMLTKSDPNKILISNAVYDKVKGQFDVHRWEPVYVKGKRDPLTVFEVVEALPATEVTA